MKETLFKALIFERLNGVFKSSIIHEEKIQVLSVLNEKPEPNTKEKVRKYKQINEFELKYDRELSRIDKQSTELFDKMQNKDDLEQLFENCTDLYNDFTKLFLKAYYEAKNKLNVKSALLVENENGKIDIDGKKYDVYHS